MPEAPSYNINWLKAQIFSVTEENFEPLALEIFRYQVQHIDLYRKYLEYLGINPNNVKKLSRIPFLPVEFFKKDKILAEGMGEVLYFESSGTTGMELSKHYIADEEIYRLSIKHGFERMFGSPGDYVFLSLLPAYAEREHSSLVYMMNYLGELSGNEPGWFLYNHEDLFKKILEVQAKGQKIFLTGVTFALLDFAEKYKPDLKGSIVLETGGMKGRRKEMIREEVHKDLSASFNLANIHSEYGMTEMLSQGYSERNGEFSTPPWLKILIRDTNDPFTYLPPGQTGGINIIDLANLYSCSFIEVKDLGRMLDNGKFEVLGRFDNSDLRGCSLLYR
jgi:phenylacetate-coenzyme A ligase PaaK-like adenylate-forming protein